MAEEATKIDVAPTPNQNRRRMCVVCDKFVFHNFSTSFTSAVEKQKRWVDALTNGDLESSKVLMDKVSKGRKYICFAHFGQDQFRHREDGKIEVLRNGVPNSHINTNFEKEFQNRRIEEKIFSILVDATNHYIEEAMNKV